jgi:2-oxo-4-hydroxy-4-carboxy-5-ureidoimidazoline decarboxylase
MAASPWIDRAGEDEARMHLAGCCGSERWTEAMLRRRPFGSDAALLAAAREVWFALTPDDWREAFSHHPAIGDRESLHARFPLTAELSSQEQRGVLAASATTLDALATLNREYQEKFGYIFIVCATGKSAEEMLAMLRSRLGNDEGTEMRIAAEEQAKITALRLLGAAAAAGPARPQQSDR